MKMKTITLLLIALFNLTVSAQTLNNDNLSFYLLRGLTREAGHWGDRTEKALKLEYPNAVINYLDLPGAGIYHQDKAPLSIKKMVEFIKERDTTFMNDTNDKIIVASSLGGIVAMEWVLQYPMDFVGAVLMSASYRGVCDLNERINPDIRPEMRQVLLSGDTRERENLLVKINANDSRYYTSRTDDWTRIQNAHPMTKANIARQTIAGLKYSADDRIPSIPILFLASEGDRMVCVECAEKIQAHYGGQLAVHEWAGHSLPDDAPEWIVENISAWTDSTFVEEENIIADNKVYTPLFEAKESTGFSKDLVHLSVPQLPSDNQKEGWSLKPVSGLASDIPVNVIQPQHTTKLATIFDGGLSVRLLF